MSIAPSSVTAGASAVTEIHPCLADHLAESPPFPDGAIWDRQHTRAVDGHALATGSRLTAGPCRCGRPARSTRRRRLSRRNPLGVSVRMLDRLRSAHRGARGVMFTPSAEASRSSASMGGECQFLLTHTSRLTEEQRTLPKLTPFLLRCGVARPCGPPANSTKPSHCVVVAQLARGRVVGTRHQAKLGRRLELQVDVEVLKLLSDVAEPFFESSQVMERLGVAAEACTSEQD